MAKAKEEVIENGSVEPMTDDKAKETMETLNTQFQEHSRQAEFHKTMATKAQGALEVMAQLYPNAIKPQAEENSEG